MMQEKTRQKRRCGPKSATTKFLIGEANTHHGHARGNVQSRTYRCWASMKARCRNPTSSAFARYGAVGIAVCERWMTFERFLADMGPAPSEKHSLDRWPDGKGNYEPGNVRWATPKEQMAFRVGVPRTERDKQAMRDGWRRRRANKLMGQDQA